MCLQWLTALLQLLKAGESVTAVSLERDAAAARALELEAALSEKCGALELLEEEQRAKAQQVFVVCGGCVYVGAVGGRCCGGDEAAGGERCACGETQGDLNTVIVGFF